MISGESWDELEKRAAKCTCIEEEQCVDVVLMHSFDLADKKHAENGKGHDSDDSDRPKKKVAPKANGKSKGKA